MPDGQPPGEVERRARWPVGLGPAVPLDEVGIEGVDASEQLRRGLDQPREQRDPEAEVGRRDAGRPALAERRVHGRRGPPPSPSWR